MAPKRDIDERPYGWTPWRRPRAVLRDRKAVHSLPGDFLALLRNSLKPLAAAPRRSLTSSVLVPVPIAMAVDKERTTAFQNASASSDAISSNSFSFITSLKRKSILPSLLLM